MLITINLGLVSLQDPETQMALNPGWLSCSFSFLCPSLPSPLHRHHLQPLPSPSHKQNDDSSYRNNHHGDNPSPPPLPSPKTPPPHPPLNPRLRPRRVPHLPSQNPRLRHLRRHRPRHAPLQLRHLQPHNPPPSYPARRLPRLHPHFDPRVTRLLAHFRRRYFSRNNGSSRGRKGDWEGVQKVGRGHDG